MTELTEEKKIERIRKVEEKLKEIYEVHNPNEKLKKYYEDEEKTKDKIESIEDLMYKMMYHSQNGNGKYGIKLFYYQERFNDKYLCEILSHYNPQNICKQYENVDSLWKKIESTKDFFTKENRRNKDNWKEYTKTVFYIAKFLEKFEKVDDVINLFKTIYEKIPYCLPKCIQIIPGFGTAFSADFIKELKYRDTEFNDFIKPDVHLKEFMSKVFKVKGELPIYYKCLEIVKKLDWTVYKFDKIIYLYCTHNFYANGDKKPNKNTGQNEQRRKNLIDYVNGEIDEL